MAWKRPGIDELRAFQIGAAAVAEDDAIVGTLPVFLHRIRRIRRRLYQIFIGGAWRVDGSFPKMVRSLIPSAQSGTMKKRATQPANPTARIHCAFRAGDRADGETLEAISKSYRISIAMISRL